MCKIIDRCEDQSPFIGFKVVVKYEGKYYSPFTGISYHQPIPTKSIKSVTSETDFIFGLVPSKIEYTRYFWYESKMIGKTGVIVDAQKAQDVFRELSRDFDNLVIVKAIVEEDLHHALFDYSPTVVGNKITILEEIPVV